LTKFKVYVKIEKTGIKISDSDDEAADDAHPAAAQVAATNRRR
jgi:hypothetical protein